MDYLFIAAILTFFILFYVNTREGYTDSHINNTIESITVVKGNVNKTLNNIKDLTGTNTGTSSTIDLMDTLEKIQTGLDSAPYKDLNDVSKTTITNQKNNILSIQNNIISIRKKLKEVLDSVNVSIVPLNSTGQKSVPLIEAINSITQDLNKVTDNLNKVPDS